MEIVQVHGGSCQRHRSFSYTASNITVSDGCRATFAYGYGNVRPRADSGAHAERLRGMHRRRDPRCPHRPFRGLGRSGGEGRHRRECERDEGPDERATRETERGTADTEDPDDDSPRRRTG